MPRHECDRSLFGDYCSVCEHDAGYREGHADGYVNAELRWMFFNRTYDFAKGYRAGYRAGQVAREYREDHQC